MNKCLPGLLFVLVLLFIVSAKADNAPSPIDDLLQNQIERISISATGDEGNDDSLGLAVSADGRTVVFYSHASNLVADDTNDLCADNQVESLVENNDNCADVFIRDRFTGQITRVSVASNGAEGNGGSFNPTISADSRIVAFPSDASNLVTGDYNGVRDIFVHILETNQTTRISVADDGDEGNADSYRPVIATGGGYVVFRSYASNLVSDDTNNQCNSFSLGLPGGTENCMDVFLYNLQTAHITRISVASDGSQSNGGSGATAITPDGRFVIFQSLADNLVPNDTNNVCDDGPAASPIYNCADIFVHDTLTGKTERVSIASDGAQGNNNSWSGSISADGRYVAFSSRASNLVSGDTNNYCDEFGNNGGTLNCADIFVHDRNTGETTRISVAEDGTESNGGSYVPMISGDGRYVVFRSTADNLVSGDTNGAWDIFIHDRQTGQIARVSLADDGAEGNGDSAAPHISADGRVIVFRSDANNLIAGDTNGYTDIFVRDWRYKIYLPICNNS